MKPSSIAEPNSSADKSPVGIVGDASLVCSRTIHSHDLCLDVEGRITLISLIFCSKKVWILAISCLVQRVNYLKLNICLVTRVSAS